jgi:hypothetical protein
MALVFEDRGFYRVRRNTRCPVCSCFSLAMPAFISHTFGDGGRKRRWSSPPCRVSSLVAGGLKGYPLPCQASVRGSQNRAPSCMEGFQE